MTDFSRLPFGMDEDELNGAFRQFLHECRAMTPAETAEAVAELTRRIDYNILPVDIREGVSQVLIDIWDEKDIALCRKIAGGLVSMWHPKGKALLQEKASCGVPEIKAIAVDGLGAFPKDTEGLGEP